MMIKSKKQLSLGVLAVLLIEITFGVTFKKTINHLKVWILKHVNIGKNCLQKKYWCTVFLIRLMLKKLKLQSWFDHNVYIEVPNDGQKQISTRWVLTEKFLYGNKTTKACLVARGLEEDHLAKLCTDSPTCGKESLRIVIAIIITYGWEINLLDIKSAFLKDRRFNVTYTNFYILESSDETVTNCNPCSAKFVCQWY